MAKFEGVDATGNQDIDGLLSGGKWDGPVTYSFPDAAGDYPADYGDGEPLAPDFAQISAEQQATVHGIMAQIGQFTNLSIQFAGANGADIRIAQSSVADPTAYGYYPEDDEGGDVWFGTEYDYRDPIRGDYSYLTHLHEIGHALGLKHGHDLFGPADVALPAAHDALEYSVMTYRSFVGGPTGGGYTNGEYGFPTSYMMNDIRALQEMYGANFAANSGNTVYSWSATTGETFIDGIGQGQPSGIDNPFDSGIIFMTVWDGGGNDTYSFADYTTGVTVNLNPGAYSVADPEQLAYLGFTYPPYEDQLAHGNIYNAYLYNGDTRSYIENVAGGSGGDILTGNAIGNRLDGSAGADTLTGGGGRDVFVFHSGYGADIVTDFTRGFDDIDLSGFAGFGSLAAVLAVGSQVGANAVFAFGLNLSLTLRNVTLASLSAGDFVFGAGSGGNDAPTDIALGGTFVRENQPGGVVGAITVADPDDGAFAFSVSDARFEVAGAPGVYALKLIDGVALDYDLERSVTLTVTATDSAGQSISEDYSFAVFDERGNSISGTPGRDIINATRSPNPLRNTTAEEDTVRAGYGDDAVAAGNGGDELHGDAGNDVLYGEGGNDRLIGGLGSDRIYGGAGHDVIVIQSGDGLSDAIGGGDGTDTIEVAGAGPVFLTRFSAKTASIEIWDGNDQAIYGSRNADVFDFANLQSAQGITFIDTGAGNDRIAGTTGGDDLRSGSGNDTIYGLAGNDRLSGGTGNDTVDAGGGDDVILFGGSEARRDVMRGGAGLDTAKITGAGDAVLIKFDASAQSFEKWDGNGAGLRGSNGGDVLNFSGLSSVSGLAFIDAANGNDRLVGSLAGDVLLGGGGNDAIAGGLGGDVLTGGAGNDALTGGKGNDRFVFAPGFGRDVITDFAAGPGVGDVIAMDHLVFADLGALLAASKQVGGNVVITDASGDMLTLEHLLLSNLHASDFSFV